MKIKYNYKAFLATLHSPQLCYIADKVYKSKVPQIDSLELFVDAAVWRYENMEVAKPSEIRYTTKRHINYLVKIGFLKEEGIFVSLNPDFIPDSQLIK